MPPRFGLLLALLVLSAAWPTAQAQTGAGSLDYYVRLEKDTVEIPLGGEVLLNAEVYLVIRNLTCALDVDDAEEGVAWADLTLGKTLNIPVWASAEWVPRKNVTFRVAPGNYGSDPPPIKSVEDGYQVRLKWDPHRTPANATFNYEPSTVPPSDHDAFCVTLYPAFRHWPSKLTAYLEGGTPPVPQLPSDLNPTTAAGGSLGSQDETRPADASIAPGGDSPFPGTGALILLSVGLALALTWRRR